MRKEFKVDSVPDLVKRITEQWDKKRGEALLQQAEQKEKLRIEIRNEREITEKLKEAHLIASKMEKDYSKIEVKVMKEKRREATKGALREADVKSGKTTLKEFMRKGKRDKTITDEVMKKSAVELEARLTAIRDKNLEALRVEKSLLETQNLIRNLSLRPIQILKRVLKDCKEITETEEGLFLADNYGRRDDVQQVEIQLQLAKGVSLIRGKRWDRLPIVEARRLQFSPIIPLSVLPELKRELSKFKDGDIVNVAYYWRTKELDVSPGFSVPHRVARTIDMSELSDVKGKTDRTLRLRNKSAKKKRVKKEGEDVIPRKREGRLIDLKDLQEGKIEKLRKKRS